MSIRTKLLILLLLISLIPLLCINVFSTRTMKKMGEKIAQRSSDSMVQREKAYLLEKISDTGAILNANFMVLQLAIEAQIDAVENAIAEVPKNQSEKVSKSAKSVTLLLAPRIKEEHVREDTYKLSRLVDQYDVIRKYRASNVLRQYTGLASGVFTSFPVSDMYPKGYDARHTKWYKRAVKSNSPVLLGPVMDLETGMMVNTVAAPVLNPDGSVAGVTAMDYTFSAMAGFYSSGNPELTDPAKVFIANLDNDGRLSILGVQVVKGSTCFWEIHDEKQYIKDPSGKVSEQLLDAGGIKKTGVMQAPFEGVPHLWAYTPLNVEKKFLVAGVPLNQVLSGAENTKRYVKSSMDSQIQIMAVMMLTIALIVCVISMKTSGHVTRPLAELSKTAGEIAKGDLDSRISFRRDDEIGALGVSVNNMADSIRSLITEQETAHLQMLSSLSVALETKDAYTALHSARVAETALRLGERIGLDEKTMDLLERGALVHDLGKIGISDSILNKNGALTSEEFSIICKHPVFTGNITRPLVRFKSFAEIASWHHERWDGKGYPDGLSGEEIPFLARIVSIADTWDAMTGDRIYRKGMPVEKALVILDSEKDSGQFDPKLIREFIEMIRVDLA